MVKLKRSNVTWVVGLFLVVNFSSCDELITPQNTGVTTIFLTPHFLQGCDQFFEPVRNLTVVLFVDGLDDQGQVFNIEDESELTNNEDTWGYEIPFVAPTEGNYMIMATVVGGCYDCCGNILTDMSSSQICNSGLPGDFLMVGMSVTIQGGSGVPSLIQITPEFEGCSNCGC